MDRLLIQEAQEARRLYYDVINKEVADPEAWDQQVGMYLDRLNDVANRICETLGEDNHDSLTTVGLVLATAQVFEPDNFPIPVQAQEEPTCMCGASYGHTHSTRPPGWQYRGY